MKHGIERALEVEIADQAFEAVAIADIQRPLLALDNSCRRQFVENTAHSFPCGARQTGNLALIGNGWITVPPDSRINS